MKKFLTTILAILLALVGFSALAKYIKGNSDTSTSTVHEFKEFPFEENEILMNFEIDEIEAKVKNAANKYASYYELSYYRPTYKQIVDHPTYNDLYEMQIKINDKIYKRAFQHVISDKTNLDGHFDAINDTWGNDSSVVCEATKIIKNENYYSASISKENSNSACLLSKYYYASGKFDIYAQAEVFDYGCFGFWLTGIENEQNNPSQELTMELFKTTQIAFSSSSTVDNYKTTTITSDVDFTKWHKYSIDFTDRTKANFLIDDKVVYSITENLPTCEHFRVNVGLLYPQTGWTGNIDNSQYNKCSMRISNFTGTTL